MATGGCSERAAPRLSRVPSPLPPHAPLPPHHLHTLATCPQLPTQRSSSNKQHSSSTTPHQQEVDAPEHGVAEVVGAALVLKLDVQAVLNAHLHLCVWCMSVREQVRVHV